MPSARVLASWYQQLSQTLEAGLPLPEALELAAGPPPADLRAMARRLRDGVALDTVLREAPAWLRAEDRLFLSAGAEAGQLPKICRTLAEQQAIRAQAMGETLAALAYPVAVLHLAALVVPASRHLNLDFNHQGPPFDTHGYLIAAAAHLAGLWMGLIGLAWLVRHPTRLTTALLDRLPWIGTWRRAGGRARFTEALGHLLDAGVPIREAFAGSALVCGHPDLRARLLPIAEAIERGQPPGPQLMTSACFPADYNTRYLTAERTGALQHTLPQLAAEARREASNALARAAFWYPKLVFFIAAIYVAFGVISAYSRYFQSILELAQ